MRSAVEEFIYRDDGKEIRMTVSAGVASGYEGDYGAPDELIKRADKALYAAKEGGRNRVVRSTELDQG